MKTELYKSIKAIDIKNLSLEDREDLLGIFMSTKNDLIRNHIALIFSDLQYNEAIPSILKKINDKETYHNNGTLVYALENLDTKKYFLTFIKIICEHEYEPRLMAYGIVKKYSHSISSRTRKSALQILENYRLKLEQTATDKGENGTLHFVEKTIDLLQI